MTDAFEATTEPQIKDTRTTDEKGVKRAAEVENLGNLSLSHIPSATGRRTTFEVDRNSDIELTLITEPHINLVRVGVSTDASTVLAAVISTDSATSALAIRETRLLAVPPGEHPTSVRPRKSDGGREKSFEEDRAESGMKRN
mmetsp:Transcript_3380/g.6858  ORF Transcript_3380/g.6858 Transcript_3380/m.6858 type:complete len:142 (-) Transcript_3380:937-1362(-)